MIVCPTSQFVWNLGVTKDGRKDERRYEGSVAVTKSNRGMDREGKKAREE